MRYAVAGLVVVAAIAWGFVEFDSGAPVAVAAETQENPSVTAPDPAAAGSGDVSESTQTSNPKLGSAGEPATDDDPLVTTSTEPVSDQRPEPGPDVVGWSSAVVEEPADRPAPARLDIPALDVSAPIIAVGVAEDSGQMEVVNDVSSVGWYRYGPQPGDVDGSTVMAAHVDLVGAGPGVFFDLDELAVGDEVTIIMDDGTALSYQTIDNRRVGKDELDLPEIFRREGAPVVRLVTCGGSFNRTERSYEDNVVVTLSPRGTGT